MRKFFLVLILIVSVSNLSSCSFLRKTSNSQKSQTENRTPYTEAILIIEKKVIDLTAIGSLFGIKEFDSIFENPDPYFQDAIIFISNSKYSYQQKLIAIYSMNKLDIGQYVALVDTSYNLFKRKQLTEDELIHLTIYQYPITKPTIKYYYDKKVIELLSRMKMENFVSEGFKTSIDNILAGKTWQKLKADQY